MSIKDCFHRNKTYIIAEMSANHANDLSTALKIVEAAKAAGADCLKTQLYTADTLTIDSIEKPFQIKDGLWWGQTLYNLYKSACMPWKWHSEIRRKCAQVGIDFLSTAYDRSSVDYLVSMGIDAIKIASFEIVDIPLITYAARHKKTMLISCGMSTKEEIEDAVNACRDAGNNDIVLLKCSSEYPADIANLNLNTIPDMVTQFGVPVGFSDHSLDNIPAVIACSLGACVIEKHFCLSREIESADCAFSLDPPQFSELVRNIRTAELSRGEIAYGVVGNEEASFIFRRSLFAVEDISEGEIFTPKNIKSIRPGYGLSPKYYYQLLGTAATRNIRRGEPIRGTDLGGTV